MNSLRVFRSLILLTVLGLAITFDYLVSKSEASFYATPSDYSRLSNQITVGPEFEFDMDRGLQAYATDKSQVISSVESVLSATISTLNEISTGPLKIDHESSKFIIRPGVVEKTGIASIVFRKDHYGFKKLTGNTPLYNLGRITYFTLELIPVHGNQIINKPILISYTKDDVLFEVKISPLKHEELVYSKNFLDDLIFLPMEKANLIVPSNGGGHIHLGLDSLLNYLDHDYKKVSMATYNFLRIMYESDRVLQSFFRPHRNYAITPSMISAPGRKALEDDFIRFKNAINEIHFADDDLYYDWLLAHLRKVTLERYFDELGFDLPQSSEVILGNKRATEDDIEKFQIKPNTDEDFYPAFRVNAELNTMEVRAIRSQSSMDEFIEISQFLTRVMARSVDEPLTSLKLSGEMPQYQKTVDLDFVASEMNRIFKYAGYDKASHLTSLIRALNPHVDGLCD